MTEKDREAFRPITEFVTHEMKKTLPGPAGRLLDMLTQWVRASLFMGTFFLYVNDIKKDS